MAEPGSHQCRWVAVVYWLVWGYLAVALGTATATATWIMPIHAAALLLLALAVSVVCGLGSAWLLWRSYRGMGNASGLRWLGLGSLVLALSNGLGLWGLWPLVSRPQAAKVVLQNETHMLGLYFHWFDGRFIAYQLSVLVLVGLLVVFIAWVMSRLVRMRPGDDKTFRRRLIVTFLLCCLLPPGLMYGGLEVARRNGMLIFVAVYGGSMMEMARQCLEPRERTGGYGYWENSGILPRPGQKDDKGYMFCSIPTARGPFNWVVIGNHFDWDTWEAGQTDAEKYEVWLKCVGWDDVNGLGRNGETASIKVRPFCRVIYHPLSSDLVAALPEKRYELYEREPRVRRIIWGGWEESGPQLYLTVPPDPESWGMAPPPLPWTPAPWHLWRSAGAPWHLGRSARGLAHLKGLAGLAELDLSYTKITDAELLHLKGLTGLRELDLSGTNITDTGLAHLKGLAGLEQLDLRGTRITDAGLAHLKSLTGLRTLYLGGTEITDAGAASLRKALPEANIRN